MAKRIIKKLGGDRIGSGKKMTVAAHGYGFSTHDVSKVRRTSISFGTIVPMYTWLMTTGSRLRLRLDALITSNALNYQLYGSAKFQLDVFSTRIAVYNPKMSLNLNDQGYSISDIKFPQMELTTNGIEDFNRIDTAQVNPSSLLRYLGIAGNGFKEGAISEEVKRAHNAMWLLNYYQIVKEYYANKQEKIGVMIHNTANTINLDHVQVWVKGFDNAPDPDEWYLLPELQGGDEWIISPPSAPEFRIVWDNSIQPINPDKIGLLDYAAPGEVPPGWLISEIQPNKTVTQAGNIITAHYGGDVVIDSYFFGSWKTTEIFPDKPSAPTLKKFDLKEVDKMSMKIMANVENTAPVIINELSEFPYGASFKKYGNFRSINGSQEGLCLGTYQSDVFNNWLDNATINALNNKSKVKVDENGEFSIDMLNLTQKLYNYDMRIGITDGTLEEWRELTYAQLSKGKSLKPVYEGGLSKEIVFDQVVSTAGTESDPLGTIASRGQFGAKHKGGYVQIEGDEEKLVMVLAKITPRLVYSQGTDWTNNLKTLEDLHKPAFDKIGYQNLLTDQMFVFETKVKSDGTLVTRSAGKQPAWQWYRTNYDDALGNMACGASEDYKVFGRTYEPTVIDDEIRIKDLTTYIDPVKFNDVFAIKSLDYMNFDLQVGIDATFTNVMSEEVIPGL